MHWTRSIAALGVVLGALGLAQGGCEPRLGPADESAASNGGGSIATPASAEAVTAELGDQPPGEATVGPAVQPAVSPGPARGLSPAPGASPSAQPQPSRAAAKASPTAEAPADLVAVSMAKDNRVAEVDPLTGRMVRIVDLSEPAGKMALTPDGHSAWVFKPLAAGNTVAVLDIITGDRRQDIQFHETDRPSAAAFSSDGSRAFVATDGSIVFTSSDGKEFGRISVGQQTAGVHIPRLVSSLAISPTPSGDVLYAADQSSGVVWVLDAGSGALLNEIDVGGGPTNLVLDPARARAYALVDTINQVVTIDTSNATIVNRLTLPAAPVAAAVRADGGLFVTGGDTAGEVWVVTRDATDITARVPIGGKPIGIALSPDGKSLFVADASANVLNIISADTIQVIRTLTLPSEPVSVVANHAALSTSVSALATSVPVATATLVTGPTPLPEGAIPPDKLPAGAVAEPFVPGAAVPAALAFAPDGRLFYNELRTGRIRVVQNGVLLPDPFYQFLVADQTNTGLLGLTLDPDFQHNHFLYVLYTAPKAATGGSGSPAAGPIGVVRLTDADNKGTDLRPVLHDLPFVGTQSSGAIRFGADGQLYVALADDDKGTNAQDLSTPAGKILRVNPDGSSPPDNPFAGQAGKQDAIWAYGLHNAYSFAFHPLGHQLLAVDSGAGDRDALDLIVRGGNYGFPSAAGKPSPGGVVDPLAVITPSIHPTGSAFYIGDQLPDWKNDLFYCEAAQKQLRRVRLAAQSFDRIVFEEVVKQGCSYDVATGPDGALYYSDAQGIYRIRMPDAEVLPALKVSTT